MLAFVANQSNPNLPLLQAAVSDAQNELSAAPTPITGDQITAKLGGAEQRSVYLRFHPGSHQCRRETGATLLAAAGINTESFDVAGKNLTIVGGYDTTCTNPILGGITEIHASAVGSVVDVSGASILTLRNLDLSGAHHSVPELIFWVPRGDSGQNRCA